MPQPIEKNEVVASLRVAGRVKHERYRCSCYRCKRSVTVAGRSLRRKKVNCPRCYPNREAQPSQVFYTLRGWPTVNAEVAD